MDTAAKNITLTCLKFPGVEFLLKILLLCVDLNCLLYLKCDPKAHLNCFLMDIPSARVEMALDQKLL